MNMGPLAGIRVLDLTSVLMGPCCTQILADLGADVVKLESPEGDTTRYVGVAREHGRTGTFLLVNRGKRGIVVDLRRKEGKELCLKLMRNADVLIHSIRPQAIEKLGLHYGAAKAANPQIIYCNLLGFGRGGRYSGKAAYDDTIEAASGLAMLQAEQIGTPQYVTTVVADKVGALTAAYAVMAAIVHRCKTGEGQEVEVGMFESMTAFLLAEHLTGAVFDPPLSRPVYPRLVAASRRPFKTADGYISVMVYNDKQWNAFARIANRPDLADDERFATTAARSKHVAEYYEFIEAIIAAQSTGYWLEAFDQAGIPAIRLNRTDDLFDDPHLNDVGFFKFVDTARDGRLKLYGSPVKFSRTQAEFKAVAPDLGEHTREVLSEAGLRPQEIDELVKQRIVAA